MASGKPTMDQLSVRLPDRMLRQLDALALERDVTRTGLVRQLLEAGLRDRPDTPSEEELLDLLAEKARRGHVAAIRTLLVREEQKDPRRRLWRCSRGWRRDGNECVALQRVPGARAGSN
jgi:predicted DNA-binding protein